MLTADQTIALFEGLRRAQSQGRYAPHKPLLVRIDISGVSLVQAQAHRHQAQPQPR